MKFMYLNIFEGCPERTRFKNIISFINKQKPDILGLSELNNWGKNNFKKLKEFQNKTKFKEVIFCKSLNEYNLAILSNTDFINFDVINEGFKTGMIKAKIKVNGVGISIILTHLHSISEDLRLKEVDIIKRYINKKENTIFMGDLNSLSNLDNYNERKILADMKNIQSDKFGTKKLRKEVINKIMKLGFIDPARKFSKSFEYSVPTKYNKDEAHFTKLRLDYIFVTKRLSSKLRKAKIIRTKETNQLSDHFPVVAEINL